MIERVAETAALDCAFDEITFDVSFDFTGTDEGDQVLGNGWGRLPGSDTINGKITFHKGDDNFRG